MHFHSNCAVKKKDANRYTSLTGVLRRFVHCVSLACVYDENEKHVEKETRFFEHVLDSLLSRSQNSVVSYFVSVVSCCFVLFCFLITFIPDL